MTKNDSAESRSQPPHENPHTAKHLSWTMFEDNMVLKCDLCWGSGLHGQPIHKEWCDILTGKQYEKSQ